MTTLQERAALLPCPFCGGKPVWDHNEDFNADFIRCDCGASHWGEAHEWNRRVEFEVTNVH